MSSRGRLAARLTVAALFALTIALGSITQFPGIIGAQGGDSDKYFPETRHWIKSPFREFFDAHGGLRIFGYPVSEQTEYPKDSGRLVQLFQRARMEVEKSDPDQQVTLGKLAVEMGYSKPPLTPDQIPAEKPYLHYFPESGHSSAYVFLDFYNRYGGEPSFGYPISEPMWSDGRLIQYFERVRMEWWPERPPDQRVALRWQSKRAQIAREPKLLGLGYSSRQGRQGRKVVNLFILFLCALCVLCARSSESWLWLCRVVSFMVR